MIKLVVFDWNGTLIADSSASAYAVNRVLKSFGGNKVTLKDCRGAVFLPAVDFYAAHGCDRDALLGNMAEAGRVFHSAYESAASKARSRRGARTALSWLLENNIGSIVLSNHMKRRIETQLQRLGIGRYISEVLANSEQDAFLKPGRKCRMLEGYIGSSGLEKSEVMMVGDSPEDVGIAKSIGMTSVAITGGFYSAQRLRKSAPDYTIGSLGELVGIVRGINGDLAHQVL